MFPQHLYEMLCLPYMYGHDIERSLLEICNTFWIWEGTMGIG
jgi:hypothetical protein